MVLTSVFSVGSPPRHTKAFTYFITRDGDKLYDGANVYRAGIGFNTPGLAFCNDRGSPLLLSDSEIEDVMLSLNQMGVQLTRVYALSVATDGYITGPRTYNETAFRHLDKVLQLASQYNIRVIIPFIDAYTCWGGIPEFVKLRYPNETTADLFFTDPTLKDDFKDLMSYVVNRTNYYTGVQYKNDPTIFGWQVGNELVSTPGGGYNVVDENGLKNGEKWEIEMAEYLKNRTTGIDTNHIVISGKHRHENGVSSTLLNSQYIDVIDLHTYSYLGTGPIVTKVDSAVADCIGKKPLLIGEMDDSDKANIHTVLDMYCNSYYQNICGALVWGLRGHTDIGGFYKKKQHATPAYSYNWPGSTVCENISVVQEITLLNLVREHAYTARGETPPALPVPPATSIIESSTKDALRVKGAAGAMTYEIQRAPTSAGPWTTITSNYSNYGAAYKTGEELVVPDSLMYSPYNDSTAPEGDVYYRARGKNSNGVAVDWGPDTVAAKVSTRLGPELLFSPGFEDRLSDGTSYWSGTGLSYELTSTMTTKYTGDFGVGCYHRPASWYGMKQDIKNDLNANGQGKYYIQAWMHTGSGSCNGQVSVLLNTGSGLQNVANVQGTIYSDKWVKLAGIVDVSWSGTLAEAYLKLDTTTGTSDIYLDEVSFKKVSTPAFSDDFEDGNYTDNPIWSVVNGTWSVITDGTYVFKRTGPAEAMACTGNSSWTDYGVEAKVKLNSEVPDSNNACILGRYSDDNNNFYMLKLLRGATHKVQLYKKANGILSEPPLKEVDMPTINLGQTYTLRLELNGSTLTGYVDGEKKISYTDTNSPILNGKIGVRGYAASFNIDDIFVDYLAPN